MTDTDSGRDRDTVGEAQRRLRNVGEGREARKRRKERRAQCGLTGPERQHTEAE